MENERSKNSKHSEWRMSQGGSYDPGLPMFLYDNNTLITLR